MLDPGLRTAIAAEMWRVLGPGGAIVSCDILPASRTIRVIRWLGKRRRGTQASGEDTPTVGISVAELHRLFPLASGHQTGAGLAFGLCGIARYSYVAARLLAHLPPLQEHGVCVLIKPQSPGDGAASTP